MSTSKSHAAAKQLLTAVGFRPGKPLMVVGEIGDAESEESESEIDDQVAEEFARQYREFLERRQMPAEQQNADEYEEEYKQYEDEYKQWLEGQLDDMYKRIGKTNAKYAKLIYKLDKAGIPKTPNLRGAFHDKGPLKGFYTLLFKPDERNVSNPRSFKKEWEAEKVKFIPARKK